MNEGVITEPVREEPSIELRVLTLEQLCEQIFTELHCLRFGGLIPEIVDIFSIGQSRLLVHTIHWRVEEVGPAIIFMVLKREGFFIHLGRYVSMLGISKRKFSESLKLVVKHYPEFQRRDKAAIIKQYLDAFIPLITENAEEQLFIRKVARFVYPFICFTKEEISCAVMCALGILLLDQPLITIFELCNRMGVSQGSLNNTMTKKVFSKLGIKQTAVLKVADIVKSVVLHAVSGEE